MPQFLNRSGRILIRRKELCDLLGITPQALGKWGVRAAEREGREAFYSLTDVIANRSENEIRKLEGPKSDEPEELKSVRSKREVEEYQLTRERRIQQQLKNEVAAGELIPTEFATWALGRLAAQLATIFDTLPLAVKRAHPDLEARHLDTISKEIAHVRNEAASWGESLPDLVLEYDTDQQSTD